MSADTMSDTSLLEVPQSDAVALLTALGYKTAKKMSIEKLTEQINAIEEAPAEPLEDESLDELLDSLMSVEVATVIADEPEEEEVEEEVPAKKSKKSKKAKPTKAEPKAKKKAPASNPDKLTRAAAAARFITSMKKPLKRDAIIEGADQLYADAGGTPNVKEAAFGYRVAVEVMKELDLVSIESGVVTVK